jgi:hypothetical protein
VVARPCEASWELVDSLVSVHGPFAARGAKGEEEYPSIGWEVPVKSHQSASGCFTEHVGHQLREGDQAMVRFLHFVWYIVVVLCFGPACLMG